MIKTPTEARQLISTMVENAQQFRTRAPRHVTSTQKVSELRAELVKLTTLVNKLSLPRHNSPESLQLKSTTVTSRVDGRITTTTREARDRVALGCH